MSTQKFQQAFYPAKGLRPEDWCIICTKEAGSEPFGWFLTQIKKGSAFAPICGECREKQK